MDVRKLIDKLAREEDDFLKGVYLAPVAKGGGICLRINGVECKLQVEDREFEGWGLFRPLSFKTARLLRAAPRALVSKYLDTLAPVELILADPAGSTRIAFIAHPAGSAVKSDGPVPVHLVARGEPFRHIVARFDGFHFWFQRLHPGRNPAQAAYLRKSLDQDLGPENLRWSGLTLQERRIYAQLLTRQRFYRETPGHRRLRQALEHGGAALDSYDQKGDAYSVTFVLDGARHTALIRPNDLTVLSAGICLSGEDDNFDLQSLVGVLREAYGRTITA